MVSRTQKTLVIGLLLLISGVAVTQSLTETSISSDTSIEVQDSVTIPEEKFTPSEVDSSGAVSVIVSNSNTQACVHVGKSADDENIIYLPLKNKYRDSLTYRVNLSFQPTVPDTVSVSSVPGDEYNDGKEITGAAKTNQGNFIVELPGSGSRDSATDQISVKYNSSDIAGEVTTCFNLSPVAGAASVQSPTEGPSNGPPDGGGDDNNANDPASGGQPPTDIDEDGFDELGHDIDGDNRTETVAVRYWDSNEVGMVSVDSSGELTNLSTGNVKLPSNNSDSAALGPPLDFDGDNKLEVPFVGKTSGGGGPYLYVTDSTAALPTRVTEVDMKPKGARIGRANVDGNRYADVVLINQNNNYIQSIDGSGDRTVRWHERGLKELKTESGKKLHDITSVSTVSGQHPLFAVGGNGEFIQVQESLTGYSEIGSNVKGPKMSNSYRTVASTSNGSEIWAAGSSGSLVVYNRSKDVFYNLRHKLDFDNTFYDMEVETSANGNRSIYLVNQSKKVSIVTVNYSNAGYKIAETDGKRTPSGDGLTALDIYEETVYVGDKNAIYKSTSTGWTTLDRVNDDSQMTGLDVQSHNQIFASRADGELLKWNGRRFIMNRLSDNGNKLYDIDMLNESSGVIGMKSGGATFFKKQLSDGVWEQYDGDTSKAIRGVETVAPNESYGVGSNGRIFALASPRPLEESSNSNPNYKSQRAIGQADLDSDGDAEFVYQGSNNGYLRQRDNNESRELLSTNNKQYGIKRIASGIRDVDGDSRLETVFYNGNNNGEIRVLDLTTFVSVGVDAEYTPQGRNMALIDLDSDQTTEIIYVSKNKNLRVLDLVEERNQIVHDGEYRTAG
jgi:hypothetical protein